jgi:hypothetical protein
MLLMYIAIVFAALSVRLSPTLHLLVTDHLGTSVAVVEVVRDTDHAHRGDIVSRRSLNSASAAHASKDLDRSHGSLYCVHAVAVSRSRDG